MHITINQQSVDCNPNDSLHRILVRYCEAQDLVLNEVAVTHDDTLIPRSTWPDYQPKSGDTFTLFSAVAGG